MTAEIQKWFKLYNHYISDSQSKRLEGESRHATEFQERRWGDPLNLEEFTSGWRKICRDPALKRLWEERLRADAKHDAVGKIIDRLARVSAIEDNEAA